MFVARLTFVLSLLPALCLAGANFGTRNVQSLADAIIGKWKYEYSAMNQESVLQEVGIAEYAEDGTGYFEYDTNEQYIGFLGVRRHCELRARIEFTWSVDDDTVTEITTRYEIVEYLGGDCTEKYGALRANPSFALGWTWTSRVISRTASRLTLKQISAHEEATTILTRKVI